MSIIEDIEHGGDISAAETLFGIPDEGWMDLSTGINPWPYPLGRLDPECWTRLPHGKACERLIRSATERYGVAESSLVVAAPGTQALIQWLPRLRQSSRVCVLGPTYGEHAHVWQCQGHDVTEVAGLDKVFPEADVVIVVNPNNPDGMIHKPEKLLQFAGRLAERGGWLVVDEAFADLTPEISISGHAGAAGLIVLRSFGKFFGLAGVRLGFALAPSDLVGHLRQALGPWAVSGPAAEVGTRALADGQWIANTRNNLAAAAKRLDRVLDRFGHNVIGGTTLFRLVETPGAGELHAHLARRGILVRSFSENRHWLRFGLPADEDHWRRLEAALLTVNR